MLAEHNIMLKTLREQLGLSLRQIEAATGLSRETIRGYETNPRSIPSNKSLHRLFTYLGINPNSEEAGRLMDAVARARTIKEDAACIEASGEARAEAVELDFNRAACLVLDNLLPEEKTDTLIHHCANLIRIGLRL